MPLRIYTDESAPTAIASGLRQRGIDSWSARDAANLGLSDEEQLAYAGRERAVIFTHDHDFLRIAHEWTEQARAHWGIVYVHEDKLSIGDCVHRVFDYARILDPDDFRNELLFL